MIIAVNRYRPDVAAVIQIRVCGPVTHESDRVAVRAPHGVRIVIVAGGKLQRFFFAGRVHIYMCPAAIQIAHVILFELHAVDDMRQWFLVVFFIFGQIRRAGIPHAQ